MFFTKGEIKAIITVGIALAKNVFAAHPVSEFPKPALVRPDVLRAQQLELIADLLPCLSDMQACSGAATGGGSVFEPVGTPGVLLAPVRSHRQVQSGERRYPPTSWPV